MMMMLAQNSMLVCFLLWVCFPTVTALLLPPALVRTACGFVAGSAGAIAAYPIDFVKSQLQTEAGRAKYSGGVEAALDIVKEDGPMALYRGVLVQVCRARKHLIMRRFKGCLMSLASRFRSPE